MSAEQVNNKTRLSVTHVDCGQFFFNTCNVYIMYTWGEIPTDTPLIKAWNTAWYNKLLFSTNISLYLGNDRRL